MASADTVTLACGCVIAAGPGGATLTPSCAEHTADPQALAIAASQDPVVQALAGAATDPGTPGGFSYSGDPSASALDHVRFVLSDTKAASPLFSDGEIRGVLADLNDDWLSAALVLVDVLTARYAGACDESVGSVSIAYSQKADGYRRLADTLRARLGKRGIPYAGGIDRFDKWTAARDVSRVQPNMRRGMFQLAPRLGDTMYNGNGEYFAPWSTPFFPPGR